jgi:putative endonuclease
MYFVYLLKCKDSSLYCGITTDIARRFDEHRLGKGAKYTRAKRAGEIVYVERKKNRSTASRREALIKKLSRLEKLRLIKAQGL